METQSTGNTGAAAARFRVAVFADFVCPYSFLAVEQIDRLARVPRRANVAAALAASRHAAEGWRASARPKLTPKPSGATRG